MNTSLKKILIGLLIVSSSAGIHANDLKNGEYRNEKCTEASNGRLDVKKTLSTDPQDNAFLLSCAVSVVVPEVNLRNGPHEGYRSVMRNKQKIADHFLAKPLDLSYKTDEGNNLVMSVTASFLPETWKEKTIANLLGKGMDLKEKNHNGDTALDIAKFKGNARIIELVSH